MGVPLGAVLAGCGIFGSDPRDAAAGFLAALARDDASAAGQLTTDPVPATEVIRQVRDGMRPQHLQLTLGDVRSGDHVASASFAAVWDLGRGRLWSYQGDFELVPADSAERWLVRWSPAVLHPRLGPQQRLALRELPAEPAPVVDRSGAALLSPAGSDPHFAPLLVAGIRKVVEQQLSDAAGWRVVTVTPTGREIETLASQQPREVPALTATIDRSVQSAGQHAVDAVSTPAMIVAIQPSTGEILGVAENSAAAVQGPLALTGRYPPGATFKIVTAVAALEARQATPDSPVACPASAVIGERVVANDDSLDLGTVPLHTAFAQACDTSFAQLGARLDTAALTEAAHQMGIGMNYDIAGISTITGQVPPSESMVRRAENGFGLGRVFASPFGMALVASTVATGGRLPTPTLIREIPTHTVLGPVASMPGETAAAVRAMMHEAVTQGTAQALAGQGQLYGKTGTVPGGDSVAQSWFVGFRGDLAFATLVSGTSSPDPALDVTRSLLSALGSA